MLHTLLLYLLFTMKWMTVELVDYGALATCCKEISDKTISAHYIMGYKRENPPPCPLNAIQFTTINGRYICSDPESTWAKWVIKELDSKKCITTTMTSLQGNESVTTIEPTTNKHHQTNSTSSFTKNETSVETERSSSSVNELPTTKYTSFCLKEEPAESTSSYF